MTVQAAHVPLILRKNDGKAYVGLTNKTIEDRWIEHCQASDRGVFSKFYNAIRKYGKDNWSHEVLVETDANNANEAEIKMISEYDTLNNGYNMTSGGDGIKGLTRSEEHKRKIGEAHRGKPKSEEHKRKLSVALIGKPGHKQSEHWRNIMRKYKQHNHPMYGKKHSEETKQKISIAGIGRVSPMKGKTLSPERCKLISEGLIGKKRGPISEECRKKISNALKGRI